jgi:hypothetical protein
VAEGATYEDNSLFSPEQIITGKSVGEKNGIADLFAYRLYWNFPLDDETAISKADSSWRPQISSISIANIFFP